MGRTAKKTTKTMTTDGKEMDLGAIRKNFDGLKDRVNKLPETKYTNELLTDIENVYFDTVSWFKQLTHSATAIAGA